MAQDKSLVIVDTDESTRNLIGSFVRAFPGGRVAAESGDSTWAGARAPVRPSLLVAVNGDDERIKALETSARLPTTATSRPSDTASDTAAQHARRAQEFPAPGRLDEPSAIERLLR